MNDRGGDLDVGEGNTRLTDHETLLGDANARLADHETLPLGKHDNGISSTHGPPTPPASIPELEQEQVLPQKRSVPLDDDGHDKDLDADMDCHSSPPAEDVEQPMHKKSKPSFDTPHNLAAERCHHPGCNLVARFGEAADKKAMYCKRHTDQLSLSLIYGMTISGRQEGNADKKAMYCKRHTDQLTNSVQIKKLCQHPTCTTVATFGVPNTKSARFCSAHMEKGMSNLRVRACAAEDCHTRPAFNHPGVKTPMYCSSHKKEGMINVRQKACAEEGCLSRPRHGTQGGKAQYCAKHKAKGMDNVVGKMCEGPACKTIPSFNVPGVWTPRFCAKHKTNAMVNVLLGKPCKVAGCKLQANYNEPGLPRQFCEEHKTPSMVWNNRWLCAEPHCKTQPMYGSLDSTAFYCGRHRKPGQLNFSTRNHNFRRLKTMLPNDKLPDVANGHMGLDMGLVGAGYNANSDLLIGFPTIDSIPDPQMYSVVTNAFLRGAMGPTMLQQTQFVHNLADQETLVPPMSMASGASPHDSMSNTLTGHADADADNDHSASLSLPPHDSPSQGADVSGDDLGLTAPDFHAGSLGLAPISGPLLPSFRPLYGQPPSRPAEAACLYGTQPAARFHPASQPVVTVTQPPPAPFPQMHSSYHFEPTASAASAGYMRSSPPQPQQIYDYFTSSAMCMSYYPTEPVPPPS
eukprot:g28957.t1